jgi:hypothetical protein
MTGAGFLVSLLPVEQLPELLSVDVVITAMKMKGLRWKYGIFDNKPLYREAYYLQRLISNRDLDLRYYQDESAPKSLMVENP